MKYILLLCISLAVVFRCSTHGGHDHDHHHHEDEEAMIQAGKEKWFKKPDDAKQDHVEDDHHHDHGHHHHHHDHGHIHDHDHDHGHGHGHHHHVHNHHHHGHGHSHEHSHNHHHGHHHHHGSGGCSHAHGAHEKKVQQPKKTRTLTETVDMWWQAIFATILISAAPFFILFFVPLESNAEEYQPMLKVLLSFASGGLLGDAFLHLIPHAIHPHTHGEDDHDHSHDHSHDHGHDHSATTIVGLWVLAGIVSFLAVEKFVRHAKGGHHHHHHHHHENPSEDAKKSDKSDAEDDKTASENEATDKGSVESTPEKKQSSLRKRKDDAGSESDTSQSKKNDESKEESKDTNEQEDGEGMKVAGFLNLAADFTHNFTDGLAIGASFLGGQTLGVITTLTILLHEVPHEIGDFAILVQSGCNKRKAMFLQLSTATGAMAGCILGLLAENIGDAATSWILPFTAGGFIYIATVSVIPELLADARPKQSIKEILAMFVGIAMMVLIGFLE